MTKRRTSGEKNLPLDYRDNKHPSKMAAHLVLHNTAKGQATLVRKTLQAGATTGIVSACLDNREFFGLIGPTRKNVKEVMQSSIQYSNRADLKTVAADGKKGTPLKTLPTKMDCPYVKAEIEACKDKAKIPIFFPDCKNCADAATCDPYQYLLRGGNDDDEGIGITLAALRAALHSEKRDKMLGFTEAKEMSWGSLKMRIIRAKVKIFIIDECHALEVPESKRVTVMDVTNNINYDFKTIYAAVIEANHPTLTGELAGHETTRKGPYAYVEDVIDLFCAFVNSPEMQAAIQKVRERMQDPSHSRGLHVERVPNPYRLDLDDPSNVGYYAGVIDQLHQMYEDIENKELRLPSDLVLDLLTMFYVVCADYVTIQIDYNAGSEFVDVVAIDHIGEQMLKNFMKERLDGHHRGILLSATPSDFNYSSLTKNGKVKELFFNAGYVNDDNRGDPTESCKKQMIIADTWKLQHRGAYSLRNRMDYIMSAIELMYDAHGSDCAVICKSKKELEIIKREMLERDIWVAVTDYYRSPDAVSTTYENKVTWKQIRVAMLIGAAEIPVHSMDVFSKSAEESTRKRLADVYQATYQTTGRIKDHCLPSLVYCIGMNPNEVRNFTTWGTEYAVFDTGKEHDRYSVKVKKVVARPILKNAKDIEDMISLGAQHMGIEYNLSIPLTPETIKSLAPQCCTSHTKIFTRYYSHTVDCANRLCEHFTNDEALYYIYKAPTKNNLFLSFRMTAIRAEICECLRDKIDVQNWGSHGFDFSAIQNFNVIDSGEGHDEDGKNDPEEIDEVQHAESELDESGKDADTANDPHAHRLNTYEQNYPLEDNAELLGLPIDDDYPDVQKEYTVESWAAWEKHLDEQLKTVRVSPGWYCDDCTEFMHHVFATRPDLIYEQYAMSDTKYGYRAKKRPPYLPVGEQKIWIERHMVGNITIGVPCIDENGRVKWGCYDIDAHQQPKETGATLIKKRYWAELKTMKLLAYLHKKGIPYILEKSGSTSSYHIWVSVVPVDAKVAMWTFRAIALAAGVTEIEVNPKQGRAGAKGSGNQVKLPFGKHQAHKGRSKLFINGKWVGPRWSREGQPILPDEFTDIMHRAIDIGDIDIECPALVKIKDLPVIDYVEDGVEYSTMESVEYTGGGSMYPGIRRFFAWLLTQDLTGEEGHRGRVYSVREFLNAGWAPEDIAKLFANQSDYNYDFSLKAVKDIARSDFGNIRYATIWQDCPTLAAKFELETGYSLSS